MWKVIPALLWAGTCVPVSNTGIGMDGYGLDAGQAQLSVGGGTSNIGGAALGAAEVGLGKDLSVRAEVATFDDFNWNSAINNATLVWRPDYGKNDLDVGVMAGGGLAWTAGQRPVRQSDGSTEYVPDGRYYYPNGHVGWLISYAFEERWRLFGGMMVAAQFTPPRSEQPTMRLRPQVGAGASWRPTPHMGASIEAVGELSEGSGLYGATGRVHFVVGKSKDEKDRD